MLARVYIDAKRNCKCAQVLGKVYDIDENGKAVISTEYDFLKFLFLIQVGAFTFGKRGLLKTYEFIVIDEQSNN